MSDAAPAKPLGDPFGERTPWSASAAVAFVLLALMAASVTALTAGTVYFYVAKLFPWRTSVFAGDHVTLTNTLLAMLVMQVTMIAATWWAAARFGGERRRVLSLPAGLPVRQLGIGIAALLALVLPYNLIVYLLWPADFGADLRPFTDVARSSTIWLGVIVLVIGAPLSEELMFRGFLMPALARTGRDFRLAAFVSTAAWTALHFSYSMVGITEVFLVGLLFAYLVRWFENLWLPIVLHALYNGAQLAILAVWAGRM